MRCLSLTQPWATLVANGSKKIETRSWATPYRGRLAIAATKEEPKREYLEGEPFRTCLAEEALPRGVVVAVVTLTDCIAMTAAVIAGLSAQERAFGGYEPGRFAWAVTEPRRLREPVPVRGKLGVFELDPKTAALVDAQVRATVEPNLALFEGRPTVVVNLRAEPHDVYIGRPGKGEEGYFGNPFPGEPLHVFKAWFFERVEKDAEYRQRVLALRGRRLGCFCKPRTCHGDVIAGWVDQQARTVEAKRRWSVREEECEERAAILEFDAGLPREGAESAARSMLGLE